MNEQHQPGPTLLSVAYPFAAVGPAAVGGAETILTALEAGLAGWGYNSLVVAAQGSRVAGTLVPVAQPAALLTEEARAEGTARVQRALDQLFSTREIALVHMHGIDFHLYRLPPAVPVLVTLHLPPSWYPESIWHLPAQYRLLCVSETQLASCPAHARARLSVVPNGVPIPASHPCPGRHRFALMLSRICPEKNLHAGLVAAKMAGIPCVLAGEVFPYDAHLRYLASEIEPRLGPAARWPGPIAGERKRRFLQAARCVLVPSLAPETSSLIAMEALAAGTPVVAFRSGALPEVVAHGETGFLVSSTEEMAEAIREVHRIDPAHCRAVAAQRFSLARMREGYRLAYQSLLRERVPAEVQA